MPGKGRQSDPRLLQFAVSCRHFNLLRYSQVCMPTGERCQQGLCRLLACTTLMHRYPDTDACKHEPAHK